MQEKIIEVIFDYNQFIEFQKLRWAESFKKIAKNYIMYTALSASFVIVPLFFKLMDFSPVFFLIGGVFFIFMLFKWWKLYKSKMNFFDKSKKYAEHYKQEIVSCSYLFSDDYIEYQDKEVSYKVKWSMFRPFEIFADNIILTSNGLHSNNFTIGKKEIGEKNFLEVCEILKEKINAT